MVCWGEVVIGMKEEDFHNICFSSKTGMFYGEPTVLKQKKEGRRKGERINEIKK